MKDLIKQRLLRAFNLTSDLYASLNKEDLKLNLSNLPSNTLGDQVWCIVGARESYIKALQAGSWQGFTCSLKGKFNKSVVIDSLNVTEKTLSIINFELFTNTQINIALDLLEHEIQHHGQLIRYIYGNKLKFPKSWHERYTV